MYPNITIFKPSKGMTHRHPDQTKRKREFHSISFLHKHIPQSNHYSTHVYTYTCITLGHTVYVCHT